MPTNADTSLLISQYVNAENLQAVINIFLRVSEDELDQAQEDLRLAGLIDSANGVWLDRIGLRFGLERPYTTQLQVDARFGFEGVMRARGFDTAPFSGDAVSESLFPLPDVVFRRIIRARAIAVTYDGSFSAFRLAAAALDPSVSIRDNLDMSMTIVTFQPWLFRLADTIGALPRTAGVLIQYRDRERFGYDEAGQPFDQGFFTSITAADASPST